MSTLWPRLRAAWVTLTGTGAAASVGFALLVFAAILASLAIPREGAGLRTGALQRTIATSRPADRTVIGTALEKSLLDTRDQVRAGDLLSVLAALRARLLAGGLPVASSPPAWASLTTGYVPVQGTVQPAQYGTPQFELTYRTALARYSRVLAGRLPVGGSQAAHRNVVQVAVTSAAAARFRLRVGALLPAGPIELLVTGIIRPVHPAAAFWTQTPAVARPSLTPGNSSQRPYWFGAVFVGPGALPIIESNYGTDEMVATWVYEASLGHLAAGQAGGTEASVTSLIISGATLTGTGIGHPVTVAIASQIPSILSPFIAGEQAAAPVLGLLYVSLTVLGAVVVLLGARMVAQRRTAEFTLMRARGASLVQLCWFALRASLVIAAVAGAAAAGLAIGLTPGDGDTVAWWLAGITIAVTLGGPVLIAVVPQRVAAPPSSRPLRPVSGRRLAARRLVAEAMLGALAIGGLVVLRNQGLTSGSRGLYTSAAPVLVAILAAVVVLRCYPPVARGLAGIAGRSRGVVAFVGLARATRSPAGLVLPSFALVLVLAMVAFPDMISTSVTRSEVAASWRQVGADAVVQAPANRAISPALQRQISAVPGVAFAVTAAAYPGSLPNGSVLTAVFADPARYASVVDGAPGPRFPLAALARTAGRGGSTSAVPAVGTTAAAQLLRTAPPNLSVEGRSLTFRLAGYTRHVPGSITDAALVLPMRALGPHPLAPNLVLIVGPGLDGARLTAVVRRALPGASVTLRSAALVALASAPWLRAAQTALTQGLAVAAGFGALVLLLSLLLTAATRELTLASLATMGLRRWQAQLLLAGETLPPVVAAAIGGVACAWLLAPLIGPSLDLASLSGNGAAIVVTPAILPALVCMAGLLAAALLALAAQAVITYYRGSARALRIAD